MAITSSPSLPGGPSTTFVDGMVALVTMLDPFSGVRGHYDPRHVTGWEPWLTRKEEILQRPWDLTRTPPVGADEIVVYAILYWGIFSMATGSGVRVKVENKNMDDVWGSWTDLKTRLPDLLANTIQNSQTPTAVGIDTLAGEIAAARRYLSDLMTGTDYISSDPDLKAINLSTLKAGLGDKDKLGDGSATQAYADFLGQLYNELSGIPAVLDRWLTALIGSKDPAHPTNAEGLYGAMQTFKNEMIAAIDAVTAEANRPANVLNEVLSKVTVRVWWDGTDRFTFTDVKTGHVTGNSETFVENEHYWFNAVYDGSFGLPAFDQSIYAESTWATLSTYAQQRWAARMLESLGAVKAAAEKLTTAYHAAAVALKDLPIGHVPTPAKPGADQGPKTPPPSVNVGGGDTKTPPPSVNVGGGDTKTPPPSVNVGGGDTKTPPPSVNVGGGDTKTPPPSVNVGGGDTKTPPPSFSAATIGGGGPKTSPAGGGTGASTGGGAGPRQGAGSSAFVPTLLRSASSGPGVDAGAQRTPGNRTQGKGSVPGVTIGDITKPSVTPLHPRSGVPGGIAIGGATGLPRGFAFPAGSLLSDAVTPAGGTGRMGGPGAAGGGNGLPLGGMPMGGMGGAAGQKGKDRERKTWLAEDEEVWGAEESGEVAVIGREYQSSDDEHITPTMPRPGAPTPYRPGAPVRRRGQW